MRSYRHVLAYFYGSPWAILPSKLAEIEAVLARRVSANSENVQLEQFLATKTPKAFDDGGGSSSSGRSENPGYRLVGNTAIIPISGTITPRPSIFEEYSGGCSHEGIGRATDNALADGKVEAILYDIDSPGGVVYGIPENGAKVLAAQKSKPTTAVVNHVAASAAYWYATQAGEIVVSAAGQVGCIGVIMANVDETKANEMEGVRYDLVTNDTSPYKAESYPQVPVTTEALADMKAMCNKYAEMFTNAVAKGRNVRPATVDRDFGKGRMLLPEDALSAKMVDKIGTLQETVNRLAKPASRKTQRAVAARMAELGLRTRPE